MVTLVLAVSCYFDSGCQLLTIFLFWLSTGYFCSDSGGYSLPGSQLAILVLAVSRFTRFDSAGYSCSGCQLATPVLFWMRAGLLVRVPTENAKSNSKIFPL